MDRDCFNRIKKFPKNGVNDGIYRIIVRKTKLELWKEQTYIERSAQEKVSIMLIEFILCCRYENKKLYEMRQMKDGRAV